MGQHCRCLPGDDLQNFRSVQHLRRKAVAAPKLQPVPHQRALNRRIGSHHKEPRNRGLQLLANRRHQVRPEADRGFAFRHRRRILCRGRVGVIRHRRAIVLIFVLLRCGLFRLHGSRRDKRAALHLLFQPGETGVQCFGIQTQLRLAQLHNAQLRVHAAAGAPGKTGHRLLKPLHHANQLGAGQRFRQFQRFLVRRHAGKHGDPGVSGGFQHQKIPGQAGHFVQHGA